MFWIEWWHALPELLWISSWIKFWFVTVVLKYKDLRIYHLSFCYDFACILVTRQQRILSLICVHF
jgi:hypothetical protein